MNEQTRQHYLKNLGLPIWLSTVDLPNALATPPQMLEVVSNEETISTPTPSKPVADAQTPATPTTKPIETRASIAQLKSEFSNLSADKKAPAKPVINKAEDEQLKAEESSALPEKVVPKFRLRLLVVSKDLIILDDIGDAAPGYTRYHRQFVTQVLTSLRLPTETNYDVQEIHWPLVPNAKIDQSPEQANRAVVMKLRLAASKYKVKRVLLCGEHSSKWGVETAHAELPQGISFTDEHRISFIKTHGLDELLQSPKNKRQFWQHIKHLRNH